VGAVSHVDFSPVYPFHYAVTSSTRVIIYDAFTRQACAAAPCWLLLALSGPALGGCFLQWCTPIGLVPVRPDLHHRPSACARQVRRTISRFKDRAYSGSFRADGKLLVAGSEDAVVQARAFPTLNP